MPAETAVDVEKPRARQDLASASTIKTILVHVQNDKSVGDRLETALSIARATSAHVSCLHVTPIQAYGAWGDFAGVLTMNDAMNTLEKEEAQLREKVEAKLGGEDVSWDYEQVTGDVIEEIVRRSTLTDLVVTGREPFRSDYAGSVISILGDVLHWSRTPLFIPVHDAPVGDLNGSAVIAWDGSCEAANAVKSALGLLKLASDIRILQVRQSKPKGKEFPGTKLLEYLSRQGMHAELILEDSSKSIDGEDFIAASLMGHARSLNAAYVVMGGYGHSRIGEFLFGGVTRIMLSRSSVPLVTEPPPTSFRLVVRFRRTFGFGRLRLRFGLNAGPFGRARFAERAWLGGRLSGRLLEWKFLRVRSHFNLAGKREGRRAPPSRSLLRRP